MLAFEQADHRDGQVLFLGNPASVSMAAAMVACGEVACAVRSVGDAEAALALAGAGDVIIVDAAALSDDALADLFDWVERAAREQGAGVVVAIAGEAIDLASARLSAPGIDLLVDPSDEEHVATIGLALARARPGVNEEDEEAIARRLRHLSDEAGRIARALTALRVAEPGPRRTMGAVHEGRRPYDPPRGEAPPVDAAAIRGILRARRLREHYFDGALFADPAWDMLLDLTAARLEGRPVAVSSLCIAAAVPPTTGLRWIKTLTEQGLIERVSDPLDKRRVFIALADHAAEAMLRYLGDAARVTQFPS